jgi:hypothetical protein
VGVTAAGFEVAAGAGTAEVGGDTALVVGWIIEVGGLVTAVVVLFVVELHPISTRVQSAITTEIQNNPACLNEGFLNVFISMSSFLLTIFLSGEQNPDSGRFSIRKSNMNVDN